MQSIGKTTKADNIRYLEGKEVQTGDGQWHLVKNGQYRTAGGATVRLQDLAPYHLLQFRANSREPGDE